jgi:hypothetical protein
MRHLEEAAGHAGLLRDASATDPACSLAPAHHVVEAARAETGTANWVYRISPV